jgi:hypothetical protein
MPRAAANEYYTLVSQRREKKEHYAWQISRWTASCLLYCAVTSSEILVTKFCAFNRIKMEKQKPNPRFKTLLWYIYQHPNSASITVASILSCTASIFFSLFSNNHPYNDTTASCLQSHNWKKEGRIQNKHGPPAQVWYLRAQPISSVS